MEGYSMPINCKEKINVYKMAKTESQRIKLTIFPKIIVLNSTKLLFNILIIV